MSKKPVVIDFWKFNPDTGYSEEQAAKKAKDLEHHAPRCTGSDRYFKFMGWAFDIGRKPYLIEADGYIERVWGRSVDDVRFGLSLSRKVPVVADPFKCKYGQ